MEGLDPDSVTPVDALARLHAQQTVWVAAESARPVAFAACEPFLDALHLWELDVRRELQGRGIGRLLIAAVADGARERGLPGVTLTTFRDIPWNAPFYARVGFRLLAPTELNPRLREILAREAERGMKGRCAMRLEL